MKKLSLSNISHLNALFLLLLLITVSWGNLWMSYKGLETGTRYWQLFTFGSVSFLLIFLVLKESKNTILNSIKLPISNSYFKGVFMFFFGIIIALLLFSIGSIFNLSIFEEQMPKSFNALVSFSGDDINKPFAILQAQNDPFFTAYSYGPTASINEEWVVGLVINLLGFIFSFLILKYVFKFLKPSLMAIIILGFLISIIIFSGLHYFNSTYVTFEDYLWAAIFRAILNVLIFVFNFNIEFGIGFHWMINWIFLGLTALLTGLFTLPGIILSIFFILLFMSLLLEKDLIKNIKKVFRSLRPTLHPISE